MALVKETHLYEVLARYDRMGNLVGCHRTDVTRIVDTDTGQVEGVSAQTTVPISQEEAATLITESTYVPEAGTEEAGELDA